MNTFTTRELDNIARRGLKDLEDAFSPDADQRTQQRAELALKVIGRATSRRSADNNLLAVSLKVAKTLNLNNDELQPLWKLIIGELADDSTKQGSQIEASSEQTQNLRRKKRASEE